MPSPDQLRSRITDYVATVNSRDAKAIAALFTEDARQADPVSNPPNIGRAAITSFFENSIGGSESWTFTAKAVHTCANKVAIDFEIALVTGVASMTIDGIEVAPFDDGKRGALVPVEALADGDVLTVVMG